ncbi:MAG: hypothetical protein RIS70_4492 [Planctomycetota bacterium]
MTHGSKRFLHPDAIKRISRLELRAQHIVEGFLSGMHRSPYFGQSVEFLQHREYVTGDDLRHVDWKVWARQDRLYVKQFEEETNLRCTLLVDISNSMLYGNGSMTKYEYGCTVAACLAYLVLRQQDAVGCVAFDDDVRARVPVRSKRNHILSVIETLDLNQPRDKTDMFGVLRGVAEAYPRRGMMVLISDLLTPTAGLFRGLRMLRQRGHDVLVLQILDDDELDFPFDGPTRFEGLETLDTVNCNPRSLREGYLQALQAFLAEVRRECAHQRIHYAMMRTRQPLDAALATFLSSRMGQRKPV